MKIRKLLIAVIVCIGAVLLLSFIFREKLVNWVFSKVQQRAKTHYHLLLNASALHFSGYNRIDALHLSLQPENGDTLLTIDSSAFSLIFSELLKGQIGFSKIALSGVRISVYNMRERNNLSFLHGLDTSGTSPRVSKRTNYLDLMNGAEKKLLSALNTAFEINDIQLSYQDSTHFEKIYSPKINYDLNNISATIINLQTPDTFEIEGTALKNNKRFELSIQHISPDSFYIPFLDTEKGVKCRFQTLSASFQVGETRSKLTTDFELNLKELDINYWRLAKGDVILPSTQLKGKLLIGDNSLELDSSCTLIVNNAKIQFFTNYSRDTSTELSLMVHMPEMIADTFFHALPAAAFNALHGISCSGTLAYDLQFVINTAQPDSLIFLSTLNRKNLHINHYGEENFERVNEPFVYYAYNGEQLVRPIEIGPGNPLFTPLNRVNPLLVKCVLQSEDPSFMNHRGFLPESFRESIAQDYKEKRFARGGSTISMQFVKNVFLSRDKTVTRKVQEALIVYLIENLGLISKERMLELYLNVIEWGPNVYGIGEASKFYFNKKPQDLSFNECLFLAAIIPNPKYFRYQFDKDGHVKPYMADYFKLLSTRMASRNLISDEELEKLIPDVKLTGPAAGLVTPVDTLPADEELPDLE